MAKYEYGPVVQLIAGATFAETDLYKFVAVNSSGRRGASSTSSGWWCRTSCW